MTIDQLANITGALAAILGTICWLPQLIKVWKTKQTSDLSLSGFLLIFIVMFLWLIYGTLIQAAPIIIANIISCAIVALIIIAKLKYK